MERVEVQLVAGLVRECLQHVLRVDPGSVEASVDGSLDAAPERVEQARDEEGRGGRRECLAAGDVRKQRLEGEVGPDEGGARMAVTAAYARVRPMRRSMSYSR